MAGIRERLQARVHDLVGFNGADGSEPVVLDRPAGDAGLFGPGSAAWEVHADFTAMMAGGVAALLLQMLHPSALAGVWDHSRFRGDMTGRLRRTAQFLAGTTYGGTAEAERLIARVRAIHDRVQGRRADGIAYSANDPLLLTWIHVAETTSFLAAHLRFRDPFFSADRQDLYHREMAVVAERLGASDVPRSRRGAAAFLEEIRPELRADERTREIADAILNARSDDETTRRAGALLRTAAVDLLPGWAAKLHGLDQDPFIRGAARIGMGLLGPTLRWALRDGSARQARRRVG